MRHRSWWSNITGDGSTGKLTLKHAFYNSVNTVGARLVAVDGAGTVRKLATDFGVSSLNLSVPSIALGTADLSVYEMVAAYGSFANQGIYVKPVMVTRIEDKNGTVLFETASIKVSVDIDKLHCTTVMLPKEVKILPRNIFCLV